MYLNPNGIVQLEDTARILAAPLQTQKEVSTGSSDVRWKQSLDLGYAQQEALFLLQSWPGLSLLMSHGRQSDVIGQERPQIVRLP